MKICRFIHENRIKYGVADGQSIYPFGSLEELERSKNEIDLKESLNKSEVKFLPLTVPSKIVCVGRNYAEHAAELGNEIPKEPLLFFKAPSSIIAEGESIVIPEQSERVEHEGELAVFIKRECKKLSDEDDAFEYVLGYACLNDVTARDIQRRDIQFTRAKSFDTFCPVGSIVETELDATDLRIETRVNGEIRQTGRTSQMVFNVPFLLKYISNQMTLLPGDIIATGTPSGVSKLNDGDICEVEIEGIGVLRNTVVG